MDINSLLSPQESPVRETPPVSEASTRKPPRKNSSKSTTKMTSSPLSQATLPPPVLPPNAMALAQQMMPSPPIVSPNTGKLGSATSTPSADGVRSLRQPSTPGMDTLADLASMQHHQQTTRANAGGLRSTEVFDSQLSPSAIYPNLHSITRTHSGTRSSVDLSKLDSQTQTTPSKVYSTPSLSEPDLQTVAQLVGYLAENPYAYESHVQLVGLLHRGFESHIRGSNDQKIAGDAHTYDLLQDLRQAREAMDSKFPMGEDLWADWIKDESILARTLEERIAVMELCQKAVSEEAGSTVLWVLYGDWMQSLYHASHGTAELGDDAQPPAGDNWSEDDKLVGREVFGWQMMINVFEQGASATKWRINDSHILWNRMIELLIQDFANSRSREKGRQIWALFVDRLQVPHATWDQTFQAFSTFVSSYDNTAYEETMVTTNRLGIDAKTRYSLREGFELKLQRAAEADDRNIEWTIFAEYLEWELSQSRKKGIFSSDLTNALYQRATLRFPTDTSLWEDHVMFVVQEACGERPHISALATLERATRHCPWSGTLWSQYMLAAEREGRDFHEIEDIKHKATSTGLLDTGGMEEILKVHTAWCGFLRRRAFQKDATDEELDVAEVGIRSALESVDTLGKKKYGKDYKGDPSYRLERIYIKYLSQSGSWDNARETWKGLIPRWGDSWNFWLRYYLWEMFTWGSLALSGNETARRERRAQTPSYATAVLRQAVKRTNMDWPEKIMETFIHHCEDHEDVEELQLAIVQVNKAMKIITKRREKEATEAAALAQQQEQQQQPDESPGDGLQTEDHPNSGKRKREEDTELGPGGVSKKSRPSELDDHVESQSVGATSMVKRDRENATVVIKNLPPETTETRVRQFFRDCGTINSLKLLLENGGASATATIEFDSKEDILSAQTKDMKSFDGNAIEVQVGAGSTLFVANYPPTADEAYIRDIFGKYGDIIDVRFPSLKYNTHRRFCYVQFKSSSQAEAATEQNGKPVDGKLKLVAKISNPGIKEDRAGPLYEGREIYVSNVNWNATEEELSEVFSKHGHVEKVRIPKKVDGKSKGVAFIVFSTKEEANAALALNQTKFKGRDINVTLSTTNPAKRQATNIISSIERSSTSTSPDPQPNSNTATSPKTNIPTTADTNKPSAKDIQSRTLALLNIPDTINDARIRALVEPYGPLVKIVLRPDHGGAIIEFKDVKDAGKAELGLDGHEIAPGRRIGTGTVAEMLRQTAEVKVDRITAGGGNGKQEKEEGAKKGTMLQAAGPIKRPAQPGARRGGRGGLGLKRGGVGLSGVRGHDGAGQGRGQGRGQDGEDVEMNGSSDSQGKAKSNADFKAMFLK